MLPDSKFFFPKQVSGDVEVRRFTSQDNHAFYAAVRESIESLSYWMPWCKSEYSLQNATDWMSYCDKAWITQVEFPLGIFEISTGKVIGGTGINDINQAYCMGNLGYWVRTTHCRRGVARNAALMAADIGFKELGFTRLEIVVLKQNTFSHKVALSTGAQFECNARNRLYFNGLPTDAAIYSLIQQ